MCVVNPSEAADCLIWFVTVLQNYAKIAAMNHAHIKRCLRDHWGSSEPCGEPKRGEPLGIPFV